MTQKLLWLGMACLLISCSQPKFEPAPTDGSFNPFRSDYPYVKGESDCKWLPRDVTLKDVGKLSFKYKQCEFHPKPELTHKNVFKDNWLSFSPIIRGDKIIGRPYLGVFPLGGKDAETVLRLEVFADELEHPECNIEIIQESNDDYPRIWRLKSSAKPDRQNNEMTGFKDICGHNAYNPIYAGYSLNGALIAEKHGHIFVLIPEVIGSIDLTTMNFLPAE